MNCPTCGDLKETIKRLEQELLEEVQVRYDGEQKAEQELSEAREETKRLKEELEAEAYNYREDVQDEIDISKGRKEKLAQVEAKLAKWKARALEAEDRIVDLGFDPPDGATPATAKVDTSGHLAYDPFMGCMGARRDGKKGE